MVVVEFIRVLWVHSGTHWLWLGSFGVVGLCNGFIRVRLVRSLAPWGSWVHTGSLGCALGFVGFIRGCWVRSGAPWGSFGFIRGRLARSCWFIRGRWVRSGTTWGLFG